MTTTGQKATPEEIWWEQKRRASDEELLGVVQKMYLVAHSEATKRGIAHAKARRAAEAKAALTNDGTQP